MKNLNKLFNPKRKILCAQMIAIFGSAMVGQFAFADSATCSLSSDGQTYTCSGQYSPYEQFRLNYENVIFNITGGWATSPDIKGVGIYANGGSRTAQNNVTITTNGSAADAIRTNGYTTVTIPGRLVIRTEGSSGDGINATINSAATINIGNDADIYSKNGVAVRSNLSRFATGVNAITIGERALLSTASSGSNTSAGTGYAVYAGNRDNETESMPAIGSARIIIGNDSIIRTAGNTAYAVYANKTGQVQLGSTNITTTGNRAHGIVAEDGIVRDCPAGNMGALQCALNPGNYPVTNYSGGKVYLTGDTTITVDTSKGSYAMYAAGQDSLITSRTMGGVDAPAVYAVTGDLVAERAGQLNLQAMGASLFNSNVRATDANSLIALNLAGTSQVIGDHLAQDGGTINLNYNGSSTGNGNMVANTAGAINLTMGQNSRVNGNMTSDSTGTITALLDGNAYYTGTVDATAGGAITMNIVSNGAKWQMLNTSHITNLNVSNGGEVILGDSNNPDITNRIDLIINNLSGNGRFYVRADINRDGLSNTNDGDKIYITDSSTGSHTVYVRDANLGNVAVGTTGAEILRIVEDNSGGDATFTLGGDAGTGINQAYVDVGAYRYTLDREDRITRALGPVYWSLSAAKAGPNPPPLTNLAQNAAGLLNINYLLGYVETQTLLQRMGELRDSNSYGDVWGRVYTGKLSSFDNPRLSAWDMDYYGVQVGIDRRLDVTDGSLYIGVMAGSGKGDTDYLVGSGDTKSYHVGVYGTYQMDNGFYLDGILKYTYMRNNINTLTGGGYAVSGHGSSQGFSIGVEGGKRFYVVEPDQGWYVEPQAQLTYSRQDDATIDGSNGLRTDLEGYSSVLGRMSLIVGYEITQGSNPINLYLKTGYVREFDGKTGYTFNYVNRERYDFGGGWWDNGVGVNMQIGERHNLYMDATYSRGGSFDRKQLNIGYRYSF